MKKGFIKLRMNKKIIFTLMLGIFLFSFAFVSAGELGTFKKDKNSTLFQLCDDCTYVILDSIELPTKKMLFLNETMYKNRNSFNYYYTFSDIGDGHYNVCGDKNGKHQCEAIPYKVTPSGISDTLGFYILILVIVTGLIIFGYKVEDYNLIILGSFGLILFGLYILFYGLAGMKDPVYTWGIGIIILMVGVYFGTRAGLEQLQ